MSVDGIVDQRGDIDELIRWLTSASLRYGAGGAAVTVGRAPDGSGDIWIYQDGEYRVRLELSDRPILTDFDEPE